MSLIPSESYSFPDHFTVTRAAARKGKKVDPQPEPEAFEPPSAKQPTIVALPNPEPLAKATPPAPIAERKPQPGKIAPPIPNPALRRANGAPPRISETPVRKIALPPGLKPKMRWNNRAPAIDPASTVTNNGNGNANGNGNQNANGNGNGIEKIQPEPLPPMAMRNVIEMKPSRPAPRPPRVMPPPQNFVQPQNLAPAPRPAPPVRMENILPKKAAPAPPLKPIPAPKTVPRPAPKAARPAAPPPPAVSAPRAVAIPHSQEDFFEMFAESSEMVVLKRRRKAKMRRFMICESVAVGLLLPFVILGLAAHPENAALHWIVNIVTISAAVAAAIIPILFFALTPTLPEIER